MSRFRGKPKLAVALAQFISEAHWTRLLLPNATSRMEEFQSVRLHSSRSRVCLMRLEHHGDSIRSGPIATFHLVATPTFRIALNLKSSDSLPVFAMAFSLVTRWALPIWRNRIRI